MWTLTSATSLCLNDACAGHNLPIAKLAMTLRSANATNNIRFWPLCDAQNCNHFIEYNFYWNDKKKLFFIIPKTKSSRQMTPFESPQNVKLKNQPGTQCLSRFFFLSMQKCFVYIGLCVEWNSVTILRHVLNNKRSFHEVKR